MDDLPELPFEKVLSYLSLKDRLKARTVSRGWRNKFNMDPVKSLCYSSRSSDFIWQKSRWVSGAFAKNFISSSRFASFFDIYGQTILSCLKHLRLCNIHVTEGDRTAFASTLNSLNQLKKLDIIQGKCDLQFNLNLPMLTSLQLENVSGIVKLTLDAPRLREVKLLDHWQFTGHQKDLRVEIVHGESVERLFIDIWEYTEVKNLKNLQHLYIVHLSEFETDTVPTFLSSLHQLKEIHTNDPRNVSELFMQKRQFGRADLKIYLKGLLLNGPGDPAVHALLYIYCEYQEPGKESFVYLAENPLRLADEIRFYQFLCYSWIENLAFGLEVDLLRRFVHLEHLIVRDRVQDIPRFLDLLKNFERIVELWFDRDQQPQDLYDRLPEYCAVQRLILGGELEPSDLTFLFRLKHLIYLEIDWTADIETVRRALEDLPVLSSFRFGYGETLVSIEIDQSKEFKVSVYGGPYKGHLLKKKVISDLNAAINFIVESE